MIGFAIGVTLKKKIEAEIGSVDRFSNDVGTQGALIKKLYILLCKPCKLYINKDKLDTKQIWNKL